MKRWILQAGATNLDGLVMDEAPMPEPGPGEVRMTVHAVSLNYRDQIVLTGAFGGAVPQDLVPIADAAGVIDALGAGVTEWSVGDRVTTIYQSVWKDGPPPIGLGFGLGAGTSPGVLAERVVLQADQVAAVPPSLSLEEAATLPCAALTAWSALNGNRPYRRQVGPGDNVLVLGTGGVSLFALLLSRAAGATVTVTSSQDDKLDRARTLGAAETINYREVPAWGEEAFRRTGGADFVVNAAGNSAMDQSLAAVAPGGEVAFMGLFDQDAAAPNFITLMMKGASIRGTAVGSAAAYGDLLAFVEKHGVKSPIGRTFAFEDAPDAYRTMASPDAFGKVVIRVVA